MNYKQMYGYVMVNLLRMVLNPFKPAKIPYWLHHMN